MYYVYILVSLDYRKTYTGVTQNLQRRLVEHNQGKVSFTSKFRPFKILHNEVFISSSEAYLKERFYKSTSGRREIKKLFERFMENSAPELRVQI